MIGVEFPSVMSTTHDKKSSGKRSDIHLIMSL
jgi:hypothetical protein